jgi:hypothetical protein
MSDKDSLDEQNIINLIKFYERELRLVLEGASIDEVFNESERKKLRSKRVLGFNHLTWFITAKVKKILRA